VIESVRIEPAATAPKPPTEALRREFPTLEVRIGAERPPIRELRLEADDWATGNLDFLEFDRIVDELVAETPAGIAVGGEGALAEECALQILTRCQRWVDRRNGESAGAMFDRLLVRQQAIHDVALPLVRADYRHALDTWQWILRLDGAASLALQAAALFHDIERLVSEPRIRVEHLAPSYAAFKAAHAEAGSVRAGLIFVDVGMHPGAVVRACELIARHEQPGADPELRLLDDADALSFFSLNSPGFLDYFGPEHTRRKIRYTLGRLSPANARHLPRLRMRPDFEALLREEAGALARAPAQELGDAVA
jgi:hypothetical protein